MARRFIIALALGGTVLRSVSVAQQPSQVAPAPITIEQAVNEALDNNLTLLAQRYDVSIAKAGAITAGLRPNPVLSLGGDHLDVLGTGFTAENAAGPPEYSVRADFVMERGGKRQARRAVAELERQSAELEVRDAARRIVLDVRGAFVDVLLAKDNLTLAESNLESFRGVVAVNEQRVKSGDLAEVELLRTRLALLQFQNEVYRGQAELRTNKNRLQLLLGREQLSGVFDVTGAMRRDERAIAMLDARNAAERSRPDLLALRRSQASSLAELRLEQARGKVDYVIGAEYRRQQGINGTGNSLGVFFSLPLPVYDRNQGEIERARQQQRQIEARIRELERGIAVDVENAYEQYEVARQVLQTIEKDMLNQARDVREISQYSYTRGEATLVEFLDAQRAFNEIMQAYNEARAAYARSLYLIDAVAGAGGGS